MTWQLACSAAAGWTALAAVGLAFFQGAKHVSTRQPVRRLHVRTHTTRHLTLVS